MDQQTQILALSVSAGIGSLATLLILIRQRRERNPIVEHPFAHSTEGETRCPKCGMPNLSTDRECMSCNTRLEG